MIPKEQGAYKGHFRISIAGHQPGESPTHDYISTIVMEKKDYNLITTN